MHAAGARDGLVAVSAAAAPRVPAAGVLPAARDLGAAPAAGRRPGPPGPRHGLSVSSAWAASPEDAAAEPAGTS